MPAGRPKKQIDYELVRKLANIQCTQEEIASVLGVSTRTLQRDEEFRRIYKEEMDSGKISLRRMQWRAADRGSNTMLVWLGKQYLGQRDKHDLDATVEEQNKPDFSALTKDELKALAQRAKSDYDFN